MFPPKKMIVFSKESNFFPRPSPEFSKGDPYRAGGGVLAGPVPDWPTGRVAPNCLKWKDGRNEGSLHEN